MAACEANIDGVMGLGYCQREVALETGVKRIKPLISLSSPSSCRTSSLAEHRLEARG